MTVRDLLKSEMTKPPRKVAPESVKAVAGEEPTLGFIIHQSHFPFASIFSGSRRRGSPRQAITASANVSGQTKNVPGSHPRKGPTPCPVSMWSKRIQKGTEYPVGDSTRRKGGDILKAKESLINTRI